MQNVTDCLPLAALHEWLHATNYDSQRERETGEVTQTQRPNYPLQHDGGQTVGMPKMKHLNLITALWQMDP